MQEVSLNKAMKKKLAEAKHVTHNMENLKSALRKREQQMATWRSEKASLEQKIKMLEATLSQKNQDMISGSGVCGSQDPAQNTDPATQADTASKLSVRLTPTQRHMRLLKKS